MRCPGAQLPPGALGWLAGRDWPVSVRGLRAAVEAAAALAEPGAAVVDAALPRFAAVEEREEPSVPGGGGLDAAIAGLEAWMLRDALAASNGSRSEAARRLGVPRAGLGRRLVRLGLR